MKIRKFKLIQNLPQSFRTLALLLLASAVAWTLIPAATIFALITNQSPVPTDVSSNNQVGGVSHLLKWETVAKVPSLTLGAYFVSSSPGTDKFRIRYGWVGGKKCFISPAVVAAGGNLTVTISSGADSRAYSVPVGRICNDLNNTNPKNNRINSDPLWTNNEFFGDYAFPGTLQLDAATGLYYAEITISYPLNYSDANGQPRAGSMESNVNFVTSISQASAKLAPLGRGRANQFGLRSAFVNDGARPNVNSAVQFGMPCTSNDTTFPIRFFDPDDDQFGGMYMWVSKNGVALPVGQYGDPPGNPQNGAIDATWDPGRQAFRATAPSNNYSQIYVNSAEKGATYRMHIQGIDNTPGKFDQGGNVLSMDLPYDGIFADIDCNYDLTPATTITPPRYSYFPNISVTGAINKTGNGPVLEDHPWEIYAVRYSALPNVNINGDANGDPCARAPAANRISGCEFIGGGSTRGSTSQTVQYNSGGPDTVGTQLCFFTRVQNPTESNTDNLTWRYSNMSCSVSGIYPRTQVLGYDARVLGQINTHTDFWQSTQFGSWSEYGLFSGGMNTNMASGSGLLMGSPNPTQNDWSTLTFANRAPSGNPQFGYYGTLMQPEITELPTAPGDPKCAFNPAGTTFPRGAKCVIKVAGDLNISGPITYEDGPYTAITDIPRVIIIADNISISNNVGRIDPWLVAAPDTNPATTGRISTCSQASNGLTTYTKDPTNLTAGLCGNKLIFNGAVIADTIYLHRTTPPGATAAEDVPGEQFSLRADAFLSSFAGNGTTGPIATTDSISELPPRF